MRSRHNKSQLTACVIVAATVFGGFTTRTAAQDEGKAIHLGTKSEIYKNYNSQLHIAMRGGDETTIDRKVVEAVSKQLVWPLTWPDNRNSSKKMERVLKKFDSEINYLVLYVKKDTTAYRKELVYQLAARFQEILKHPITENRVAIINACYLMPKMGRLQVIEGLDYFIKLAQDPKMHPIIKMAAMRGMQHYSRATAWTRNFGPMELPLKKRSLARVKVLTDFILHKWDFKTDHLKFDPAAYAFLRREAIKALAAVRTPAVYVDPLKNTTEGEAVYALAGVLANQFIPAPKVKDKKQKVQTTLFPPPSLKEKLEAAIGLCQIQVIDEKRGVLDRDKYRYDVSVYLVGNVLSELFKAYKADFLNFVVKKGGIPAAVPYKIASTRLSEALETLVKNITDAQKRQAIYGKALGNAIKLRDMCAPMLRELKTHKRLDELKARGFRQFVDGLLPPNTHLFEGIPESAVKWAKNPG